jgi:uncharacterized protein
MRIFFTGSILLGMIVFSGCGLIPSADNQSETKAPEISFETSNGRSTFSVEIADTSSERAQGLMNRKSLDENKGMLFIFEDEKKVRFWMKNTLIPLDMIFLNSAYEVVGIQKDVQPCKKDPCATFGPDKNVKYVLEVNAGIADKSALKEGNKAQLKK